MDHRPSNKPSRYKLSARRPQVRRAGTWHRLSKWATAFAESLRTRLAGARASLAKLGGALRKWPRRALSLPLGRRMGIGLGLVVGLALIVAAGAGLIDQGPATKTWHYRLDIGELAQRPRPVRAQAAALEVGGEAPAPGVGGGDLAYAGNIDTPAPEPAGQAEAVRGYADAPLPDLRRSGKALSESGDYYADLEIRRGESLTSLLNRYSVKPEIIHRLSMLKGARKHLLNLRAGNKISLYFGERGQLLGLKYEVDKERFVDVKGGPEDFRAKLREYPVEFRRVYAEGMIEHSLFHSGSRAGLTDKTLSDLASMFSWDIDFARDLRVGDRFEVLYEQRYINGRFVGSGDILKARIHNRSRWLEAIRFSENGRKEYYSSSGVNLRRAFIRNPLDPSKISSKYSKSRLHPVLKVRRPHTGVDYAAPTGTPIRATGYGKVSFRGSKGGYGKTVIITHGGKYQTLYAHMSRFAKSARVGGKVSQGQVIGYVGTTGLSTGPHLHYEFRVHGKHKDPQKVRLPPAPPLRGVALRKFQRARSAIENEFVALRDRYARPGDAAARLAGLYSGPGAPKEAQ